MTCQKTDFVRNMLVRREGLFESRRREASMMSRFIDREFNRPQVPPSSSSTARVRQDKNAQERGRKNTSLPFQFS